MRVRNSSMACVWSAESMPVVSGRTEGGEERKPERTEVLELIMDHPIHTQIVLLLIFKPTLFWE